MNNKQLEPVYEALEDGSIDENSNCDKTWCYKWVVWFYYVVSPVCALILLILAAIDIWDNDEWNTIIIIGTSIYIICHWGCYVVKCY